MRRVEQQWGTAISVDVRDDVDDALVASLFEWFTRVDELCSTWRVDSEVSRLAAGALALADAALEVREVLDTCERLRRETGGAFDVAAAVRAPRPLAEGQSIVDPSGFVKGWAVERAADQVRRAGVERFAIGAGGDVRVGAPPPGEAVWRVGVQHPWERDRIAAVVGAVEMGVATSGRYERGDHVLDPSTGLPARDLMSVTVVGPDLGLADAYATAVMVCGRASGMEWLAARDGYEAFAITAEREVVMTAGFDRLRVE